MSKPREKTTETLREVSDYYKLKTKSIDDLVNANSENSPQVSQEELQKYRSKSGISLPGWLKAAALKAWFAGAACFFVFWGLGMYVTNALDMFLVFGICLGMVMDLLENSIFRFAAATPGANDRWMMLPRRSVPSFFGNILYGLLLLLCVDGLYQVINSALIALGHGGDSLPLGVEPILFGIFYMGFDLLLLGIKALLQHIFSDAMTKAGKERDV